jgi:hypothetical protein
MYTAIGNNELGKERMELFYDGKSIVMKDYKILQGFGLPKHFNKSIRNPDKGHDNLLQQFVKSAKTQDAQPPIPLKRIFMATKLSLIVDRLAKQGGGFEFVENWNKAENNDVVLLHNGLKNESSVNV